MYLVMGAALTCLGVLVWPADISHAQESSCPPERHRGKALETKLFQNQLLEIALTRQDQGHPEDDPNPRPGWIPNLHEYLEVSQSSYRQSLQARDFPDTLYFLFLAQPYRSKEPEAISINRREVWCLIRAGDTVLLRRGKKNHFTSVFLIERNVGKIYLLDPWPHRFLLRSAKIVDMASKKMLEVEGKEFLPAVVGFITLDTPDLLEHYFAVTPSARSSSAPYLSFGHSLLDYGDDRFVQSASSLFRSTHSVAKQAGDRAATVLAANRLHFALLLVYFNSIARDDTAATSRIKSELEALWRLYGKEAILTQNRAIDDYRLGLRAGDARDLNASIYFLDRAIESKAEYEDAYVYRALAKSKRGDQKGVIVDSTEAIKLINGELLQLAKRKRKRHPQDRYGIAFDKSKERRLRESWALAFQLRGTALNAVGRHQEARKDGIELIQLRPESSNGHVIAGFAELLMGDVQAAKGRFETALTLEARPELIYVIKDTLAKIAKDPRIRGNAN